MAELNQVSPRQSSSSPRKRSHYPYADTDYGEAYRFEPDFSGPVKKRSCTDVLCLLLFLAFLGGWGFVAYLAISQGDIDKVIFPTDSEGHICGRGSFSDRPYLLFFDLTQCLNPAVLALGCPTPQVCVTECPREKFSLHAASKQSWRISSTEQVKAQIKPYCKQIVDAEWRESSLGDLISKKICPAWVLPSTPVVGRCLPSLVEINAAGNPNSTVLDGNERPEGGALNEGTVAGAVTNLGAFLQLRDLGERVFNDLSVTWWMICVAYAAAAALSFIWIVAMRFVAGVMVWASIGLIFTLFGGLFSYTLYKYLLVRELPSAQGNIFTVNVTPNYARDVLALADTWLAFTIILGIVFVIIVMVLIALRKRILIAIELIEQGSKVVAQLFSTLFFPIFPFILHVVIVLSFACVAVGLASAKEPEYRVSHQNMVSDHHLRGDEHQIQALIEQPLTCWPCQNPATNDTFRVKDTCHPETFEQLCPNCHNATCQFTKYISTTDAFGGNWMQWYNLFALYWAVFFVSALSELVLAGVFATWYWTWDKSGMRCCPLCRSFKNAVLYHLGTVAFGSLIIAVIRMVRTVLSYIEEKLKKYNNDLTRCLICMCKCCLYCLEKFMRFINRNAYIMCAVKGTNFCASARDAFSLLMRNLVRVVVLNKIVDFLLFLGKLVIVTGVGCLAYFVFSGNIPSIRDDIPTLNYFFTPIVVIVLGSYVIASSFFGVYEMAVDTLFLCFLEDLERNDGSRERPFFMAKGLQKVVGKMQRFHDDR